VDRHGAIGITLALLVCTTGLSVTVARLAGARTQARRLCLALGSGAVLLPVLAWAAGHLVHPALAGGVLAAGVAPSEVASVALAGMAGGDPAVAAVAVVASTLIAVVDAGPVLGLLGAAASVHPVGLVAHLALILALPLAVGVGVVSLGLLRGPALAAGRGLAAPAVVVLLWEVASQVRLRPGEAAAALALCCFLAGSVALAWVVTGGMDAAARPGILVPVALRDFAVAAGIAASAYGATAAGPLGLYGVLVLVVGSLLARAARSRPT
jgi:predicted Na+-dependent transporter